MQLISHAICFTLHDTKVVSLALHNTLTWCISFWHKRWNFLLNENLRISIGSFHFHHGRRQSWARWRRAVQLANRQRERTMHAAVACLSLCLYLCLSGGSNSKPDLCASPSSPSCRCLSEGWSWSMPCPFWLSEEPGCPLPPSPPHVQLLALRTARQEPADRGQRELAGRWGEMMKIQMKQETTQKGTVS